MDTILKNATDEQLGLAVFENSYDLFRAMADSLPDCQFVEAERFSRHFTFPNNPMFKGVWNTHLSEVASVDAVATVPSARGKGIGATITIKLLLDAREDGYIYAVLFSTEMRKSVYQRIGFRMIDVSINRYLWRNA